MEYATAVPISLADLSLTCDVYINPVFLQNGLPTIVSFLAVY
jgi:hypothetical protein